METIISASTSRQCANRRTMRLTLSRGLPLGHCARTPSGRDHGCEPGLRAGCRTDLGRYRSRTLERIQQWESTWIWPRSPARPVTRKPPRPGTTALMEREGNSQWVVRNVTPRPSPSRRDAVRARRPLRRRLDLKEIRRPRQGRGRTADHSVGWAPPRTSCHRFLERLEILLQCLKAAEIEPSI